MIGELLSAQQLYRQYLVNVVVKVFDALHSYSNSDQVRLSRRVAPRLLMSLSLFQVHDWVLLSVSSFTQLEPLSLAVWSLTALLAAATNDEWIRAR